jgi:transcriptional regulator with XRE-family HTH domain
MNTVGITIKHIREEKRIRQKELASAIGISQSHLSKIENGTHKIDADLLKPIADFLQVSLQAFYS